MLKLLAEMEKLLRLEYNLCTTTATAVQFSGGEKKKSPKKREGNSPESFTHNNLGSE
jgi:hypothetical protein